MEVALRRVGFTSAKHAFTFLVGMWLYVEVHGGPEPKQLDHYAEWWEMSRSTAYREQRAFRLAFPGYTPLSLWSSLDLDDHAVDRMRRAAELLRAGDDEQAAAELASFEARLA
jgi:hypothetical protein